MKIRRLCVRSSNIMVWLSCVAYTSMGAMSMGTETTMGMAEEAPAAPATTPTGPNTSGLDEKIGVQGNWIKKRDWLIKANEVNVEIQETINQTEQVRTSFTARYNEIDTILDEYYKNLGLGEGKVKDLLDNVSQHLEKKKKKDLASLTLASNDKADPDIQAKIEIIQDSVVSSKQQLEQLSLDMKSIEDLDKSLSDRLKRLDEQINLAHEEAGRAKNIINELWNIIDHNKARASYYELKNDVLEKVKTTQAYLNEDLSRDFDSVIETIKNQITRTQDQIKKIEADGVFIKDRAKRIKELKVHQLQDRDLQPAAPVQQVPAPPKPSKPEGILAKLYDFFITLLSKLYALWLKLTGQAPAPKVIAQPVQSSTPAPQAIIPTMPVQQPVMPMLASEPMQGMPTPGQVPMMPAE